MIVATSSSLIGSSSSSRRVKLTNNTPLITMATYILLTLNVATYFASAAMGLPDGIDSVLGFIPKSNFKCERDGYFGDVDNDCRLFHLCQKQVHSNGHVVSRC